MKRLIFIGLALALLAGCESKVTVAEMPTQVPDELKDCKAYDIYINGNHRWVMRCPNSTTATSHPSGKTKKNSVIIDGTEYVEK